MKPSFSKSFAPRSSTVALGIGLSLAAIAVVAAPSEGSADMQPTPPPAASSVNPMRDSGPVRQWSTGQVRMRQEQTEEAYILIIDLNGLAPQNVQVRPLGRGLLVRTRHDARTQRSETYGDGRGYRESYRISSGSSTRRLPVPPDGDIAHLTREDGDEEVRILIPRRQVPGWR
jgi:HSP20 family molecular chaperone IbpA